MPAPNDGVTINVTSWAGRHVSKVPSSAYTATNHAVLALPHSVNMDECVNGLRACRLRPAKSPPILKFRPVVPSEEEQAGMLQVEDLGRTIVSSQHARVSLPQRDP
jgi:NADP-dependent 3-hydroxy acid dehydrogenase YdfG